MPVPRRVYVFLAVGLAAASQSGNIIRLGDAHPVAITAWRLLLATCVLAPIAGRALGSLRALGRLEVLLLLGAGAALALHFFAWIAAVQMTTVANASTFFAVNPVITATAGLLIFRERIGPRLATSIGLGLGGVALTGLGDLHARPEHLLGDAAALLCSVLFTVYFLLGKRLRRALSTEVYVTAVYAVAAAVSFAVLFAMDLPVAAYDRRTWLCFGLMALLPTVLGHTSRNNALGYLSAGWIATATLVEPLRAGVVAHFAWGESPTAAGVAGYGLICLSVVVLVLAAPAAARGPGRRAS